MAAADVSGLEVPVHDHDLRRDLHLFVNYVQKHSVKRAASNNGFSLLDRQRLARLLGLDPPERYERDEKGITSAWIAQLDELAYHLGVTHFHRRSHNVGHPSYETGFSGHYIDFKEAAWMAFAQRPPAEQELALRGALVATENIEFYYRGPLARLDRFSTDGCATGVMPRLDFPEARSVLMGLLARVPTGTWIETAAFVEHVKKYHPYFLIPKVPRGDPAQVFEWAVPRRRSKSPSEPPLGPVVPRYDNFCEGRGDGLRSRRSAIPDLAPDGFERVEGRYIERFLEGVPLTLGYVDVAYGPPMAPAEIKPSRGCLRAFRVHERLRLALAGTVPGATVTVLPDFQVLVESPFYPLQAVHRLEPLAEVVSLGPITTLRLRQDRVTVARAADPTVDPLGLLQALVSHPIPPNVASEMAEWTGRGDAFTIYDGFGLLECDVAVPAAMAFRAESIAAGLHIVRDPRAVCEALEAAERNPLRVTHAEDRLLLLPAHAHTVFPKRSAAMRTATDGGGTTTPGKTPAAVAVLKRSTVVTLRFPERSLLEQVSRVLLEARCPIHVDAKNLKLQFTDREEARVMAVLAGLAEKCPTRVESGT